MWLFVCYIIYIFLNSNGIFYPFAQYVNSYTIRPHSIQPNNDNDSDGDDDSNVSEDDKETLSSKPKISLEKDDDDNNNTGVYQPPRLNSVPFELDNERQLLKQQRLLAKQRDKLSRSELTQVIKSQYTDAPEEEDVHGGALLGSQSEKSRKVSQRDANIQEFEENQMIRLTMSRSEKKERKKMRRDEMSNLNVLSGGFGYAGVEDAFGEGGGNDSDDDGGLNKMSTMKRSSSGGRHSGGGGDVGGGGRDGSYKTKGMRKRKVEVLDDSGSGSKRKSSKKKGASNTYQKSLYGGGGGGGKTRKRR